MTPPLCQIHRHSSDKTAAKCLADLATKKSARAQYLASVKPTKAIHHPGVPRLLGSLEVVVFSESLGQPIGRKIPS